MKGCAKIIFLCARVIILCPQKKQNKTFFGKALVTAVQLVVHWDFLQALASIPGRTNDTQSNKPNPYLRITCGSHSWWGRRLMSEAVALWGWRRCSHGWEVDLFVTCSNTSCLLYSPLCHIICALLTSCQFSVDSWHDCQLGVQSVEDHLNLVPLSHY